MNFAIQCLEESIIGSGGYHSELTPYKRGIHPLPILFSFTELICRKLLSKEYYEDKGHKVLGKMIGNTNAFEVDPSKSVDPYKKDETYKISFKIFVISFFLSCSQLTGITVTLYLFEIS